MSLDIRFSAELTVSERPIGAPIMDDRAKPAQVGTVTVEISGDPLEKPIKISVQLGGITEADEARYIGSVMITAISNILPEIKANHLSNVRLSVDGSGSRLLCTFAPQGGIRFDFVLDGATDTKNYSRKLARYLDEMGKALGKAAAELIKGINLAVIETVDARRGRRAYKVDPYGLLSH